MNKPYFAPASFFLLRSPIWPIEKFHHILEQKNWIQSILNLFEADELLREAVLIASPSLYDSLQKKPLKNPEQVATSLFHYVLRMATRATPFGLFSFVAVGEWGPKTAAYFELNDIFKRVRPDLEWVYRLTQKFYGNDNSILPLLVRSNPLATFVGERVILKYLHQDKDTVNKVKNAASIVCNKLVKAVLRLSEKSIEINVLLRKLHLLIPNLDFQKVLSVLRQMIAEQFLLPGSLPTLLQSAPFDNFLNEVGLNSVSEMIKSYDQTPLGKGESQLANLQKEMETQESIKTCLQVDTACKKSLFQLPQVVAEELGKAVDLLFKISPSQSLPRTLDNYRAKFIEKYGIHRTVPLLELICEEKGLGSFLKNPQNSSNKYGGEFSRLWERWLTDQWQRSTSEGKKEIQLTKEEIDHLFREAKETYPDPKTAVLSLDVFFKIIAKSVEDIHNENFSLHLIQTTYQGGSTFGRFFDLLDDTKQSQLKQFYQSEEQSEVHSIFVELSYLPSSVRLGNVAIHPSFRTYRLDLLSPKSPENLSLDDIYVGATLDRFYLTLKEGKCEIETCISNLLTIQGAPLPLRFMREVTLAKRKPVYPFSWGEIERIATFLPRICFQKTILSPAKWKLDPQLFLEKMSSKLQEEFISWANRWDLPKYFLLTNMDQQLLLDRDHPAHRQEITLRIKKGQSLTFTEYFEDHWLKSDSGSHSSELVVPFLKIKSQHPQEKFSFLPPPYLVSSVESRWKLPGSDWLYVKFYTGDETDNRFLLEYLVPFIKSLHSEQKAIPWFYVRYRDPDPHLRCRLKLDSFETFCSTLISLKKISQTWMENGLIKYVTLDSYEREVERYGGTALIEVVENIFCADTLASISLLRPLIKNYKNNEITFYTLSVINFLSDYGLNHDQIFSLLDTTDNGKDLEGFRKYKNQLITGIETLNSSVNTNELEVFKNASKLRFQAVQFFRAQTQNLSFEGLSTIYISLLHMHCNRLGCQGSFEKRALAFACHSIHHLKHKKSNKGLHKC